jgi:chaperonin GroES
MALIPLHDRIIVQRIEAEVKTASGLFIPDAAREKPSQGKVIAVGAGRVSEQGNVSPLTVKVGDVVLFGKYSGTEFKYDGIELLILNESDVLAIIG